MWASPMADFSSKFSIKLRNFMQKRIGEKQMQPSFHIFGNGKGKNGLLFPFDLISLIN